MSVEQFDGMLYVLVEKTDETAISGKCFGSCLLLSQDFLIVFLKRSFIMMIKRKAQIKSPKSTNQWILKSAEKTF